jgi:hypothetical protein
VLDKQILLVIILLTSRGKSLLFTLLAYIKKVGVIIVIVLY